MNNIRSSEARRLTYIIAWLLSSLLITLVTFIPDQIAAVIIDDFNETLSVQAAYTVVNAIIGLISIATLIFVYACFRNVYIQRVMPYFWLGSALGFSLLAGNGFQTLGVAYERLGLIYIDLSVQLVAVFLIYFFFTIFWPSKYYPPIDIVRTNNIKLGTASKLKNTPDISQLRLPVMSRQDDPIHTSNSDEPVQLEGANDYYDNSLPRSVPWLFYLIFFIIASWSQLDFSSLSAIANAFLAYPQKFIAYYLGTALFMTVILFLIASLLLWIVGATKTKIAKQIGHILITSTMIAGILIPNFYAE